MFEDSIEGATPETQQPTTTAGKFINALVADIPEKFETQVNIFELDRFVSTSDENQLSWVYSTTDVPASLISITGDNVPLARVDSISDLYESNEADYCYYYNAIDRTVITTRLFKYLEVDSLIYEQTPTLKWNWFDEFGARVGLSRLYLESNSNFRKRILDVYKNVPGVSLESTKLTLRRELDIWRAYGATPDSSYLGATPELLEISDIESSTPYFENSGKPTKKFKDFVRSINEKYPTNWGYAQWDNAYWDYAGQRQEGVGRVPAVYDDATPLGSYYQPGIGDFEDAKVMIREPFENYVTFNESFEAKGSRLGSRDSYDPITISYEYYGSYYQDSYINDAATVNFDLMLKMAPHAQYATPTYFYTTITANPKNLYGPQNSASPEYNLISIFDQDGYSYEDYTFYNYANSQEYVNTSSTPSSNRINFYYATEMSATPKSGSNDFGIKFVGAAPITSSVGSSISLATPQFSVGSTNIQAVSSLYNKGRSSYFTEPKMTSSFVLNSNNDSYAPNVYELNKDLIHSTIIFPPGATPEYIHIDNIKPTGYNDYDFDSYSTVEYDGYGGVVIHPRSQLSYLVPSSPNIYAQYVDANFATPQMHAHYVNTDSSTVNYYFVSLKYPYGSTPDSIIFSTQNESNHYPLSVDEWFEFTASSTPMIEGTVGPKGVVRSNADNKDETYTRNSSVVGKYNLSYDTFGLDPEEYYIEKIEPTNNNKGVNLSVDNKYVYVYDETNINIDNFTIENPDGTLGEIEVMAEYNGIFNSFIHTGWYNVGEESHYIYANPVTESHTTPGFSVVLNDAIRQGAPLIVECDGATPFTPIQVAFYNEATPYYPSLQNQEILYANHSNYLFAGYNDIYNVEVIDSVTGYTILSDGEFETNQIEAFSSSTPAVYGRGYTVNYNVHNSFIVDNDYYDEENDKYVTQLQFDSTPNFEYIYNITYEGAVVSNATPISVIVDPLQLWDQEGFVYLSHEDYAFGTALIDLDPSYVVGDGLDYMVLKINSLDINGNSKPYQSFTVTSNYGIPENENVTTDINGFASVRVRYDAVNHTSFDPVSGWILVEGADPGNPSDHAHPNSESYGFYQQVDFEILRNYTSSKQLKATVAMPVINADGLSENYIVGLISEDSTPKSNSVIYWRKNRTLHDLFESTEYSDYVVSDENGRFFIGPIVSESKENPGMWITSVESEHSSEFNSTPTTISGDIVFWQEKYDNIDYLGDNTVIVNDSILYFSGTEMIATPNFTVDYHDAADATPYLVEPNWIPPKWYPINRYQQYIMGLLGSTPNKVDSYVDLMKEYEED